MMPSYLITWEIGPEQFADPVEAAHWAWKQMRAPGSIANVFKIVDESGQVHQVDLQEIEGGLTEHDEDDACERPLDGD
jgi:hypothetical protein